MATAPRASAGRALFLVLALAAPAAPLAEPVAVVHWEGVAHGFVALQTLAGQALADGDLVQTTVPTRSGNRVTARLVLRFRDGSRHEETTVYLQRKTFQFVSNHVVQKGAAFKTQVESTIRASGRISVRYTGEDGQEKSLEERLDLPPDVANGMILALLKNVSRKAPRTTVSLVAITPKPRLVRLEFVPAGEDSFSTGALARTATHFVVKVNVPGVAGAVAAVLGKTPPDSHVWVLAGQAPSFVKAEWPLSMDGPIWRIEMVAPVWPSLASPAAKDSDEGKDSDAAER